MNIPSGLINAVKQSQAVLFTGAGISYNAIKVGGLELRNWIGAEIAKDYLTYDFTRRSLEDVCDEYEGLYDRLQLVDLLASSIPQNIQPLRSHLAAVATFRFIVTTNWDLLVVRYSLLRSGRSPARVRSQARQRFRGNRC
jgi:hypothetical protein